MLGSIGTSTNSAFSNGLMVGIRLMLMEEKEFISESDLVHALRTRVAGTDEQVAREAASIAWAITWLHPLALGFFVFGLCAERGWFDEDENDAYVSRLLCITPANHAKEALALYTKYQAAIPDGGAAVIRGFGLETIADFEEQVFGSA